MRCVDMFVTAVCVLFLIGSGLNLLCLQSHSKPEFARPLGTRMGSNGGPGGEGCGKNSNSPILWHGLPHIQPDSHF